MNEEFIAKVVAELFDYPCNFSPYEEELHSTEERKWCEEHCNKCSATEMIRETELGRPFSVISSNPKYNADYLDNIIRTKWLKILNEKECENK